MLITELEKLDEKEKLERINAMNEEEIAEYRKYNEEHYQKRSKRVIRNAISAILKRIVDILGGIVGSILLIPLTIVVWILNIKNKEHGPIFYKQQRIGRNGKLFTFYKFRSMVIGADEILVEYLEQNPKEKEEYMKNKKLENDPRVTKTGKFLRETSIDEWPQFLNVLIGNMSLVGPRPYLPREKDDMGDYYQYIIKAKPGLTGPWQIAGRSNLTFEDRLKLDEHYCSFRSNRRDIKMILQTIIRVFKKEGAI